MGFEVSDDISPRLNFLRWKGLAELNSPPRFASMATTAGPEPSFSVKGTACASSSTVYLLTTLSTVHSTSSFILKYTQGAPLTGDVSVRGACTSPCVEMAPFW